MTSGVDLAIENLKMELNNVKLKLSECRKNGLDTKIAELKIMNIAPKINFAEVTKSYKDIEKINNMLNDAKMEIESMAPDSSNAANISPNNLKEIGDLINKINKALSNNRLQEAKNYYLESVILYKKLKNEDKKEVFKKLTNLKSELTKPH